MLKKQHGFHTFLALLVIFVIAAVGFVAFKVVNNSKSSSSGPASIERGSGPNYDALASCSDTSPLNRSFIDLGVLDSIAPLGASNPPDHTIPTDHMYFMYRYERGDSERYDLTAPGNVVVTDLIYSGEVDGDSIKNGDYALNLTHCKGISFRLGHINSLDGPLKGIIGAKGEGANCRHDKPGTGRELLFCSKEVDIKATPGEVLGKLGAKYVAALDVGVYKEGFIDPGFTTPAYHHGANAVCPLQYFTKAMQDEMYSLVRRTGEPRCGSIGQDKKDTLQGTWFAHKDHNMAMADWSSHLSLVHSSDNPSVGSLAIAGKINQPSQYFFTPMQAANVNREPAGTVAGTVYCYQHDNNTLRLQADSNGKVLFKLIDNHTMQAEHKSGTCNATEALSNPTTYYR